MQLSLGVEYLQQVKRARERSDNAVKGMTCVRRDRIFTRANLMLLALKLADYDNMAFNKVWRKIILFQNRPNGI